MIFPQCKGENPCPEGTRFRFCGHCGAALPIECPACGAALPAGFRFCGQCGTPLEADAALPADGRPRSRVPSGRRGPYGEPPRYGERGLPDGASTPSASPIPEAEQRRRVAILFADIVGSTALADRTD